MIVGLAMAAALTLQVRGVDGVEARRIYEASKAADCWVFYKVHLRLVPDITIATSSGHRHVELEAKQQACLRDLTNAAYQQLCTDYHVSKAQFNAIVRNPKWALSFDHYPEFKKKRTFTRRPAPWETSRTRFNPYRIRLPERMAKHYGYKNPKPPGSSNIVWHIEQSVANSRLTLNLKDALGRDRSGIATADSTGRR